MNLSDIGLDRLSKIKIVATTLYMIAVVLSILIIIVIARSFNTETVLYNGYSTSWALFMLAVQLLMFFSSDLRSWAKRSEIYFEMVEHNEVINLDTIKEKLPKRLMNLRKDEAIINRVNKDIKKLGKYGIIEKSEEEYIK